MITGPKSDFFDDLFGEQSRETSQPDQHGSVAADTDVNFETSQLDPVDRLEEYLN